MTFHPLLRWFYWLGALFFTLFITANNAHAGADAGLVSVPPLSQRITDLTHTLTPEQQAQLEAKLKVFEQQKGSQIAVLIVPTTQPEVIEQFSIRVVEQWKLGRQKVDDGVLLLVAKDDRKLRIEVGYGLEGVIPDLTAKRIISEIITPKFKQGDFYGGVNDGVDKLIGLVNGDLLPEPSANDSEDKLAPILENTLPFLLFFGFVSGLILKQAFGTFFGSTLNGGAIGGIVWLLGSPLTGVALVGVIVFIFTLILSPRHFIGGHPGGYSGGGFSSSGGGDVFSGGGGDFGGGGASGDW